MRRTVFVFLLGLISGALAVVFVRGPVDLGTLRSEAGEVLDGAGREARQLRTAASVRAALALQRDFNRFGGISAAVDQGTVTLTGSVGSEDQRRLAELIVKGIEGVETVVNEIEIASASERDDNPS